MKSFIPLCLLMASGLVSAVPTANPEANPLDLEASLVERQDSSDLAPDVPDASTLPESAWSNSTEGEEPDDGGEEAFSADSTDAATRGHGVIRNRIGVAFQYVLVTKPAQPGGSGVVKHGLLKPGKQVSITYGQPYPHPGYTAKLAYRNPNTSQHPEQIEYSVRDGKVYYDYSAIDGDPFKKYQRSIVPNHGGQSGYNCGPIICKAGSEVGCYRPNSNGNPNRSCPASVILAFNIGKVGPGKA